MFFTHVGRRFIMADKVFRVKDKGRYGVYKPSSQRGLSHDRAYPILLALSILFLSFPAYAFTTEASYYTVESCKREGTSGIMANGRRLDDERYTCATWDYAFGTKLRITNLQNGKSCCVEVTDRGPAKRLYKKGRKLDLSKKAFSSISDLRKGLITVEIKEVQR